MLNILINHGLYKRSWFLSSIVTVAFTSSLLSAPVLAAPKLSSEVSSKKAQIVHVTLKEWKIRIIKRERTMKAGKVTFKVKNTGGEDHELVIIKTDLAPKELPIEKGKVNEATTGQLIGEIEEFPPGETHEQTFNLEPGKYVLFCNMVEIEKEDDAHKGIHKGDMESHYEEGMRMAFTVTPY